MVPAIPVILIITVTRNRVFRFGGYFSLAIPGIPVIDYIRRRKNDMRLKHFDYTRLVKEAYRKKRESQELSPLLAKSTPGNIRRECANVYQERYEKKDEPALKAFFGPAEKESKFLERIQEFDVNRFKPLDNFLKGDGNKAMHDMNWELLAWLIDFNNRPFVYDKQVVLTEEELDFLEGKESTKGGKPTALEIDPAQEDEDNPIKEIWDIDIVPGETIQGTGLPVEGPPDKRSNQKESRKALILFVFLVILSGGVYSIWATLKPHTECMYWSDDHYESVPCNEPAKGRILIALDEAKLHDLKLINRKDTITEHSIGKLFYIKDNTRVKYYTAGGSYPEDMTRSLKKLTGYIFENDSVNRRMSQKE